MYTTLCDCCCWHKPRQMTVVRFGSQCSMMPFCRKSHRRGRFAFLVRIYGMSKGHCLLRASKWLRPSLNRQRRREMACIAHIARSSSRAVLKPSVVPVPVSSAIVDTSSYAVGASFASSARNPRSSRSMPLWTARGPVGGSGPADKPNRNPGDCLGDACTQAVVLIRTGLLVKFLQLAVEQLPRRIRPKSTRQSALEPSSPVPTFFRDLFALESCTSDSVFVQNSSRAVNHGCGFLRLSALSPSHPRLRHGPSEPSSTLQPARVPWSTAVWKWAEGLVDQVESSQKSVGHLATFIGREQRQDGGYGHKRVHHLFQFTRLFH
ncbi:hypothetical protein LY76DRAFT_392724 [Colletotrichum caudatum]|nr:hypothetical protein LY76DRAFT_392724 [Colletotrichum caudatum]